MMFSFSDPFQYPTVTICPIQFHDPWNLARGLLNDAEGKEFLNSNAFKLFKESFQEHEWLSEEYLKQQGKNAELAQKLRKWYNSSGKGNSGEEEGGIFLLLNPCDPRAFLPIRRRRSF